MIRQNQKMLNFLQVLLDILCIVVSLCLSCLLSLSVQQADLGWMLAKGEWYGYALIVGVALLHLLCYGGFHFYRSHRTTRFLVTVLHVVKANLCAYVAMMAAAAVSGRLFALQVAITLFFFINTGLLLVYRGLLRRLLRYIRKKGYNKKFVLLLGINDCTPMFLDKIRSSPDLGYELLGYFNDKKTDSLSLPFLGKEETLDAYLKNAVVDEAVIMLRDEEPARARGMIQCCEKWGLKFSIIPNIFSAFSTRIFISSFDGMPVLSLRKVPLDSLANRLLKRAFDLLGALACLVLFSPVMLAAAIAVRIDSPGPVIFKQQRLGLDRKPFVMYKFRSMRVEAETDHHMAQKDDQRCTRVGAFLRRFSIDELPQLFNVLRGNMSLVGPRPEIPLYVNQFRESVPSYMLKHYIKPGMTGWAQVNGLRGNTSIEKRIQYDMEYIENWTLWFDIKILFFTVFRGFKNENAY